MVAPEDIIKIKCPFDGKIIIVKNIPGIEKKYITCPVCNKRFHFSQYKPVTPRPNEIDSEDTSYQIAGNSGKEVSKIKEKKTGLGKIVVKGTETTYCLRPGRNVIGRKTSNSQADFKIDTGEDRKMSREHLVINVHSVPGKGFIHVISLFKEKINATYIGNERILYGDSINLQHGDVIRMPNVDIVFLIPDEDDTEMTL